MQVRYIASEFTDTISQNLNYLSENNNPIIENETFKEMKNNLSPFLGLLTAAQYPN